MKRTFTLNRSIRWAFGLTTLAAMMATPAFALKYAAPEHDLKVDPSIPSWQPGEVKSEPEEELNLVGADIMDEISLGWMQIYRKQYPRLSLTMDMRASGAGAPGLVSGKGDLAPVGRELFPAEEKSFVDKFGYPPLAIKVATGSVGSLGKTATSIILVDKGQPHRLPQHAATRCDLLDDAQARSCRHQDMGRCRATGEWASRPIHLYGLKPVNGIEQYFKQVVMLEGGSTRTASSSSRAKASPTPSRSPPTTWPSIPAA